MSDIFVVFEGAHHADGSPVGRAEALAGAWERLIEANAENPDIGGALLLLATGEAIEIDLARVGRG